MMQLVMYDIANHCPSVAGKADFTPVQQAMLYAIALQCPYLAGHAVFLARNMFALVSDTIDYNDDMICWEQYGFYRTQEPIIEEGNIAFELYPNPAADVAQLSWSNSVTGNWQITLSDITGRTLLNESINAKETNYRLNTEKLNSGLYILQVHDGNRLLFTHKLSIVR